MEPNNQDTRVDPVSFAQSMREEYPGAFDSVKDDYALAQALVEQYPEFKDSVHFGPMSDLNKLKEPSLIEKGIQKLDELGTQYNQKVDELAEGNSLLKPGAMALQGLGMIGKQVKEHITTPLTEKSAETAGNLERQIEDTSNPALKERLMTQRGTQLIGGVGSFLAGEQLPETSAQAGLAIGTSLIPNPGVVKKPLTPEALKMLEEGKRVTAGMATGSERLKKFENTLRASKTGGNREIDLLRLENASIDKVAEAEEAGQALRKEGEQLRGRAKEVVRPLELDASPALKMHEEQLIRQRRIGEELASNIAKEGTTAQEAYKAVDSKILEIRSRVPLGQADPTVINPKNAIAVAKKEIPIAGTVLTDLENPKVERVLSALSGEREVAPGLMAQQASFPVEELIAARQQLSEVASRIARRDEFYREKTALGKVIRALDSDIESINSLTGTGKETIGQLHNRAKSEYIKWMDKKHSLLTDKILGILKTGEKRGIHEAFDTITSKPVYMEQAEKSLGKKGMGMVREEATRRGLEVLEDIKGQMLIGKREIGSATEEVEKYLAGYAKNGVEVLDKEQTELLRKMASNIDETFKQINIRDEAASVLKGEEDLRGISGLKLKLGRKVDKFAESLSDNAVIAPLLGLSLGGPLWQGWAAATLIKRFGMRTLSRVYMEPKMQRYLIDSVLKSGTESGTRAAQKLATYLSLKSLTNKKEEEKSGEAPEGPVRARDRLNKELGL